MEAMRNKQYVLQTNKQTNRDAHAHTHTYTRKAIRAAAGQQTQLSCLLTNVSPTKEDKLRYSAGLTPDVFT